MTQRIAWPSQRLPRSWWRLLIPGLLGLSPGAAPAQTAEAMMERARRATSTACDRAGEPDAIIICGRAEGRYRLPLPRERAPTVTGGGLPATEALNTPGDCGPFGQRRCSKREALAQGYGGGRDPVTVVGRLLGVMPEPEAGEVPR